MRYKTKHIDRYFLSSVTTLINNQSPLDASHLMFISRTLSPERDRSFVYPWAACYFPMSLCLEGSAGLLSCVTMQLHAVVTMGRMRVNIQNPTGSVC